VDSPPGGSRLKDLGPRICSVLDSDRQLQESLSEWSIRCGDSAKTSAARRCTCNCHGRQRSAHRLRCRRVLLTLNPLLKAIDAPGRQPSYPPDNDASQGLNGWCHTARKMTVPVCLGEASARATIARGDRESPGSRLVALRCIKSVRSTCARLNLRRFSVTMEDQRIEVQPVGPDHGSMLKAYLSKEGRVL
jgi:hypothetical protein